MTTASLAAIRASDVEPALFVHVLGAIALVGTLLAAATALAMAWSRTEPREVVSLTRFGLWTIVAGTLPAWLVMRVGAQWVYSKEGWEDVPDEPGWLGVGYVTADAGGVLILVSLVLAIVACGASARTRRARRSGASSAPSPSSSSRSTSSPCGQ